MKLPRVLVLLLLAGCYRADVPRDPEEDAGSRDSAADASETDASIDSSADATVPDASMDAATDASVPHRWAWTTLLGDAYPQQGTAIASASDGATVIGGLTSGVIDFGFGGVGSGSLESGFFAGALRSDAAYAPVWARSLGGVGSQNLEALAIDGDGLVLTGTFNGELDFGAGNLPHVGGTDIFLAALDEDGEERFAHAFGSTANEVAYDVARGPSGEIVIVGQASSGAIDFGGGDLAAAGSGDAFVARFDADGGHAWSKRYGNALSQNARGVAIHTWPFVAGQTIVIGEFAGQIDFGSGKLTSAGGRDVYVACLDAAGNALFAKRFGGMLDQSVRSVALDPLSGRIAIAGFFEGDVDFGGGPLMSAGSTDAYVAVFTPTMNGLTHVASLRFGDANVQEAMDIAFDASGNVVVVGGFFGAITLGDETRTSAGERDLFAAKLTAGGELVWLVSAGDASDQALFEVAIDGASRIRVTGSLAGTGIFDDVARTATGAQDVFLGELFP